MAEAAHEARVAELEGQLASATRYADGQGQHIGQLEAQLGDAQRRLQSLQRARTLPINPICSSEKHCGLVCLLAAYSPIVTPSRLSQIFAIALIKAISGTKTCLGQIDVGWGD